jgi:hypothetical protein
MADNFLTRKLGPLPGWLWVAAGGTLIYLYVGKGKGTAKSGDGTTQDPTTAAEMQQLQAQMQSMAASAAYPSYEQSGYGGQPLYVIDGTGGSTSSTGSTGAGSTDTGTGSTGTTTGQTTGGTTSGGSITSSASGQTAATTGPANPYSDEVVQGVGYYSPTAQTLPALSGGSYSHIPNVATDLQLRAAGQQIYYQPTPGTFLPWTGNKPGAPTGTALYIKS